MALEAERYCTEEEGRRSLRAFNERHGLATAAEADPVAYRNALAQLDEVPPELDQGRLIELADATLVAWPDHAVRDYALLYRAFGLLDPPGESPRGEPFQDTMLELLGSSSNAAVLFSAAQLMSLAHEDVTWDGSDLDRLQHVVAGSNLLLSDPIIRFALDEALRAEDWARASDWLTWYDDAVEARCGANDDGESCIEARQRRDVRSGWLAAAGDQEALTWQAALIATVHECHERGHTLDIAATARARWADGQWDWIDSGEFGEFLSCVEKAPTAEPFPAEGVAVMLSVWPEDTPMPDR